MASPETTVLRLLRTTVTTGLLTSLAVWAHTRGGGMPVGVGAVSVVALLTVPLAWFAGDPRNHRLRLFGLLLLGQFLGHAALMVQPVALTGPHHDHAGSPVGAALPALELHAHTAAGASGLWPGWTMVGAHLLASALAMVLLTWGSAATRWVLRALPGGAVNLPHGGVRLRASGPVRSKRAAVLAAQGGPRAPPLLSY